MSEKQASGSPIMGISNRASLRFSTYSATTTSSNDTADTNTPLTQSYKQKEQSHARKQSEHRLAAINSLEDGLERLKNHHLEQQRFVPTPEKTESLGKLALGAKLDRALERRLHSQDAVMKPKEIVNEKVPVEAAS